MSLQGVYIHKSSKLFRLKRGGGGGETAAYKVTYDAGVYGAITQGKNIEWVQAGKTPKNVPVITPKEGYTFRGWTLDGKTAVDPATQKTMKSTTYTALYEEDIILS